MHEDPATGRVTLRLHNDTATEATLSLSDTTDADTLWRYAGHVETGRPSRTDHGIGGMVLTLQLGHL